MEIVAIENKYHVVIPRGIRNQLAPGQVDLLEANLEREQLIYRPKMVIDRIPAGRAAEGVWTASNRCGTDKLKREIYGEVSAVRRSVARRIAKPAR
jgi:hypothetical protein